LGKFYDIERTKYLEAQGFKVIRFWNSELDHEKSLLNKLKDILNNPSSVPPKAGHLLPQGEKKN